MEELQREGLTLYVRDGMSALGIAHQLDVSRTTVNKWVAEGGWKERRTELLAEARAETLDRVQRRLQGERPQLLEYAFDSVGELCERAVNLMLNGDSYCPHCGRGADSGHPHRLEGESDADYEARCTRATKSATFKPTPGEVISMLKFRMALTGGPSRDDGGAAVQINLSGNAVAQIALIVAKDQGGAGEPMTMERDLLDAGDDDE